MAKNDLADLAHRLKDLEARVDVFEQQYARLRNVLYKFIAWTAGSAASPLSEKDTRTLLNELDE